MTKKSQPTKIKKRVIKSEDKVKTVLDEFKSGKLKSSSGKIVTDRSQALAIALNEAGLSNKSLEKAEILNKVRVMKTQISNMIKKELVKEENYNDKIIDFLMENPNPPDSKIHEFAKKSGIMPDEIEGKIYGILSSFLSGGKSQGKKLEVDASELKKGIAVEFEHTNNKRLAEKIARDHLSEFENYYTWLDWMESLSKKYDSPADVKISE